LPESRGTRNTHNTVCQSTDGCFNLDSNTNVYSNSATSCANGPPDTTTVCQRSHIYVSKPLVTNPINIKRITKKFL